jgi:hypothetical protein
MDFLYLPNQVTSGSSGGTFLLSITNLGLADASNLTVTVGPCPLMHIPFASSGVGTVSNLSSSAWWWVPRLGAGSNTSMTMAYSPTYVTTPTIGNLFAVASMDNAPFTSTSAEIEVDPIVISAIAGIGNTVKVTTPPQFNSSLIYSPSLRLPLAQWQQISNSLRTTVSNNYVYILPATNISGYYTLTAPSPFNTTTSLLFEAAMDVDGNPPVTDSGTGVLSLQLPPDNGLRYVNLVEVAATNSMTTNGWVVQNLPVVGSPGTNFPCWIAFRMGASNVVSSPTNLPYVKYSFTLTTNYLSVPVTNTYTLAPISRIPIYFEHGIQDEPLAGTNYTVFYNDTNFVGMIGGQAVSNPMVSAGYAFAQPDYPNRKQDTNECCPAAVWNSLHYLKNYVLPNLPDGDITYGNVKSAVGFTPAVGFKPAGSPIYWPAQFSLYATLNGLPIVTETTRSVTNAMAALSRTNDVEINMWGHVACIRSIVDLGNGRYSLGVSHDLYQGGTPGGRVTQAYVLDTNTGQLTGPFQGSITFLFFTLQHP